jgi:hypothetical protein
LKIAKTLGIPLFLGSILVAASFVPIIDEVAATTLNHRPVITSPTNGQVFTFDAGQGIEAKISIGTRDIDGDFIDLKNTPFPAGAFYEFVEQFEGVTGASITFEDGWPFVGSYQVTFTAVDDKGATSRPVTITIKVIPPDHLNLAAARLEEGPGRIWMVARVFGDVAPTIQRPPYGFAALTTNGQNILAVATHAGLLDSEDQSSPGDDTLHTHILDVISSKDCINGMKVSSASFRSPGILEVLEHKVKVRAVPVEQVGDLSGTVISFILTIENGNTCVNPVDRMRT